MRELVPKEGRPHTAYLRRDDGPENVQCYPDGRPSALPIPSVCSLLDLPQQLLELRRAGAAEPFEHHHLGGDDTGAGGAQPVEAGLLTLQRSGRSGVGNLAAAAQSDQSSLGH